MDIDANVQSQLRSSHHIPSGLATAAAAGKVGASSCFHSLFEHQAARTPDAPAVAFGADVLTYSALNERANRLALYLRTLGIGPDVLAGIYLRRSIDLLTAILGVLKAGGAYVPLDPATPRERLSFILRDTKMPVLLTEQRLDQTVTSGVRKVLMDSDRERIEAEPDENPSCDVEGENLAYVIYTSGSTGQPKGVMIPHRALTNYLEWCVAAYNLRGGCGAPVQSSIAFDLTVTSLFAPLLAGKTVTILDDDYGIEALAHALANGNGFSLVKITPSHLEALRAFVPPNAAAASTRALVIGGEALRGDALAFWRTNAPATRLINEYGPTEATVGCCVYELPADAPLPATVPIGRPIANTQLHVLDEQFQPAPSGTPGELFIGGAGLARGYLNNPELTAAKFIRNPFSPDPGAKLYRTGDSVRELPDGNLEFLGRLDDQVKIKGYRVELDEISAALCRHAAVREAVVVAREESPGRKQLVAYVVPEREAPATDQLRDYLRQKLPEYMLPGAFVVLGEMPLTPNGKIDRRALPRWTHLRPAMSQVLTPARTTTERELKRIWEETLGVSPAGVHDNFFELGGDSLSAVQLLLRVQAVFGVNLSSSSLIHGGTIAAMARDIDSPSGANFWSPVVELQRGGSRPPIFFAHPVGGEIFGYAAIARYLGPEQPFFGLQARGFDGVEPPHTRIEEMAECYVEAILRIQPHGPFRLGGYSLGGIIAFEMAQQLQRRGHGVEFLAMLDATAPSEDGGRWTARSVLNLLRNTPYWLVDHVLRRPTRDVIADVRRRVARIARRVAPASAGDGGAAAPAIADIMDVTQLPESHRRVVAALYQAGTSYVPRPYPGRITLFRVRAQPLMDSHGRDKGWARLAEKGVEIRVVPGNHKNLYDEPHVRALARAIEDVLRGMEEPV